MADKKKPASGGGGDSSDAPLWIIMIVVFFLVFYFGVSQPFNPSYINIQYFFDKLGPIGRAIVDPHLWYVIGIISASLTIFFLGIIIYSLVRMREIQNHEKREINHQIYEASMRDAQALRNENPRWIYILTLLESPNESDWRVAIIEADTMLDEVLAERGYSGDTLGERLKSAESSGLASIEGAGEAHGVRNQIAHLGSDFPLSQIETRKIIKKFQNIFEELQSI